jgi:microcystin-dependent protein
MPGFHYRDPVSGDMVLLPDTTVRETEADAKYVNLSGDTVTGPLTPEEPPTDPGQVVTKGYIDTLLPIGSIAAVVDGMAYGSGWLVCDGSVKAQAEYPDLYAVIGTTYGAGAAGEFKLPDTRGRAIAGYLGSDTNYSPLGKTAGVKTVTLSTSQVPNKTGNWNMHGGGDRTSLHAVSGRLLSTGSLSKYANPQYANGTPGSVGIGVFNLGHGGGSHTNLQPYLVAQFVIRAE